MKVLAFGASSSSKSINKALANYAAHLIENAEVETIDLNDYEMPIFSQDKEIASGIPQLATHFYNKIHAAELVIISFAEHNGNYTAAYKNIFDWTSRINPKVYENKSVIALSTSPGPSGAKSVLNLFKESAQYFGAQLKGTFSLPNFYQNFDAEHQRISNVALNDELKNVLKSI